MDEVEGPRLRQQHSEDPLSLASSVAEPINLEGQSFQSCLATCGHPACARVGEAATLFSITTKNQEAFTLDKIAQKNPKISEKQTKAEFLRKKLVSFYQAKRSVQNLI